MALGAALPSEVKAGQLHGVAPGAHYLWNVIRPCPARMRSFQGGCRWASGEWARGGVQLANARANALLSEVEAGELHGEALGAHHF